MNAQIYRAILSEKQLKQALVNHIASERGVTCGEAKCDCLFIFDNNAVPPKIVQVRVELTMEAGL